MGYTVAAPTLLSILQSCQSEPKEVWNPVYFNADEAHVISGSVYGPGSGIGGKRFYADGHG